MSILSKNSHEVYANTTIAKLADFIIRAWSKCEKIDKYCEWDEQTLGEVVETAGMMDEFKAIVAA